MIRDEQACEPPPADSASASAGFIAFRLELLCGSPCPVCTSFPQVERLLQETPGSGVKPSERDALGEVLALFVSCLGRPVRGWTMPKGRKQKQVGTYTPEASVFFKWPANITEFVMSLSKLLHSALKGGEPRQRWTSTRTLALLGHSCVRLWSYSTSNSPETVLIPSFLRSRRQLYICNKLRCLKCTSVFPVAAIERDREAIRIVHNDARVILGDLLRPSKGIREEDRYDRLAELLRNVINGIPRVVAATGSLSISVWQALQIASRAAHAHAEAARQVRGKESCVTYSTGMAVSCLSAGVYILLKRLPLGLAQPEVSAHTYKAALMHGRMGNLWEAKQLLEATLEATVSSFGPHSVSQNSVKEYLQLFEYQSAQRSP